MPDSVAGGRDNHAGAFGALAVSLRRIQVVVHLAPFVPTRIYCSGATPQEKHT
jgi:hypothetical protein